MTAGDAQSFAELVAFWEARLAETAVAAEAAAEAYPGPWMADTDYGDELQATGRYLAAPAGVIVAVAASSGSKGAAVITLLAGQDPLRVLADVDADRKLLAAYKAAAAFAEADPGDIWQQGVAAALASAVRTRAAVYNSHPDWRKDWEEWD